MEICTPDSARQAYDALVAAAPDGSEPETQARRIADDARARGKFETDETVSRLDTLARSNDYFWDCEHHAYVYERLDEDAEDEDAVYDDAPAVDAEDTASSEDSSEAPAPTADEGQGSEAPAGKTTDAPKATGPGASTRAGTRPSPASGGNSSSSAEGTETDSREAAGPPVPEALPEGARSAGITVTASPDDDDRPGSPLRLVVGGGLVAGLAALVLRQRRR